MTRAAKNTLKCVLVLFLIAAVSVALLSVANKFLKVVPKLDEKTASLINRIAPTGYDDGEAYSGKHIKMVDLANAGYAVTELKGFNAEYGGQGTEVQALYTSTNREGVTSFVVQSAGQGRDSSIVMLIAYDAQNKISGIVTKSQNESYWSHIKDLKSFYESFIGLSGTVTGTQIAGNTGATVMVTLGGMSKAVTIANEFVVALGGAPAEEPSIVSDAALLKKLQQVGDTAEQVFTKYPGNGANKKKVAAVYVGNDGTTVYESLGSVGTYGNVRMLVVATADKTVKKLTLLEDSFAPIGGHDSSPLRNDATLNEVFGGKSVADIDGMSGSIAGTTGVTESSNGLKQAVKNALEFIDTFDKEAY